MEFINRVGVFFLWIGALSILLFFFSAVAEAANLNLLIAGFVFIIFGSWLWLKNPTEQPKSNRFRLLKARKQKQNDKTKQSTKDSAKPQSARK